MKNFLEDYFNDYIKLVSDSKSKIQDLIIVKGILTKIAKNGNKIIIVGNGGSSAIASHFSVDLTKNAKLRCINFNEADLITCFSNDYGYKHWAEKAIDFYGDKGDALVAISSSGSSKNILNACKAARKNDFESVITLSGMNEGNPLSLLGDHNLVVQSKAYNLIENIHQFWLLALVDMIIGKSEYPASPTN